MGGPDDTWAKKEKEKQELIWNLDKGIKEPIIFYSTEGGCTGMGEGMLEIYDDGTVETGWFRHEMRSRKTLSMEELKEIIGMFEDNGFFSLNENYGGDPCPDGFSYEIRASYDGKEKTVRAFDGSDAPQEFWNIQREIRKLMS